MVMLLIVFVNMDGPSMGMEKCGPYMFLPYSFVVSALKSLAPREGLVLESTTSTSHPG